MRISEIITDKQECKLHHPIVGNVKWKNCPIDGWVLIFAEGPEQGQVLMVDETVLLDDRWQKS